MTSLPILRDALAVPVLLLCVLVAERRLRIPKLKELPVSDNNRLLNIVCVQWHTRT